MTRRIRFNAFDMNCVAHQSPGLWRHPDDRSHRHKELGYWTDLAILLEQGRFDGIFIADVLGTYDVYGGNDIAALRQGAQIPVADPLLLVSAMAAVTEHLGFGITTGTGFEHPYPFARRLSTLDYLTKRPYRLECGDRLSTFRRTEFRRRGPARSRRALQPGR